MIRGLHREGHNGGHVGGQGMHGNPGDRPSVQAMVEDECKAFNCPDDKANIDCNTETSERPDFSIMDQDEKEDAWSNIRATRKEHRQQILRCVCCTDATIEEMMLDREGGSFWPFGGESSMSSSLDGDGESDTSSDGESSTRFDGGMMSSSQGGFGRPGKGSGHNGRGESDLGMMVQNMLNDHCPKFICPQVAECAQLDSAATREDRRQTALSCVCCHDDGVSELSELQDISDEEGVSVLLASLLTEKLVVQAEESYLGNPASCEASSLVLSIISAGVVFAIV